MKVWITAGAFGQPNNQLAIIEKVWKNEQVAITACGTGEHHIVKLRDICGLDFETENDSSISVFFSGPSRQEVLKG